MEYNSRLFTKALATFGFTFLAIALFIISLTPPVNGYEISIYESYPWYFWLLICLSITFGMLILTTEAFAEKKSNLYLLGFCVVISTNFMVLILPIFRGYFISDFADEVTHLGVIQDIFINGFTGARNYYPMSHILVVILSYISSLDPKFIIKFLPASLYILYVVGMYLLSKAIGCSLGQVLLISVLGSVFLFTYFNYLFFPTQVFLYYVPFVLAIYQRSMNNLKKTSWNMTLIITLYFLSLTHPLGAIFLIFIFLIFEISKLIQFLRPWEKLNIRKYSKSLDLNLLPSLILFVTFTTWFSYFIAFRVAITEAYNWIVYDYGNPPIESLEGQLQRVNFSIYDFLQLAFRTFGHDFIFASLSLVCIFLFTIKIIKSDTSLKQWKLFLSISFIFFTMFYILSLLGAFVSTGSSIRVFCWALMFSTLLNGTILHEEISKMRGLKFKLYLSILFILILLSSVIGIFSLYPSPYTKQANYQVSKMDWNGMSWYYTHKSSDETIYINQFPWRASHAIFGHDSKQPSNLGSFTLVSPHFGYNGSNSLANSLKFNGYLVISEHSVQFYSLLWPEHGLLNSSDFKKIENDSSISKTYHNGGLKIWKIKE